MLAKAVTHRPYDPICRQMPGMQVPVVSHVSLCHTQAAKNYEDMATELHKHTQLSNMFDCPEAVVSATEGVAAIKADFVLVKDVWDASSLVEQQFQVLQPYLAILFCNSLLSVGVQSTTRYQHIFLPASAAIQEPSMVPALTFCFQQHG